MASTQVLPSSAASTRKQGHLEAGKKRLEEFRRKKAEGRAKKAASTGQLQSVEVDQYEKFSQNNENVSGGATPGGDVTTAKKPSVTVIDCDEKVINFVRETDTSFSNEAHANLPVWVNNAHASYNDLRKEARKGELSMSYGSVNFAELANGYYDHGKNENGEPSHHRRPRHGPSNGTEVNGPPASSSVHTYPSIQVINDHIQVKDNHSSSYSLVEAQSEENRSSLKGNMADTETSAACLMSTFTRKLGSGNEQYSLEFPSTVVHASSDEPISGVEQHNSIRLNHENLMNFDTGRSKIADSISRHLNVDSSPWHASEPSSTDLSSAFKSSSNQHMLPSTGSGTTAGRSRPSFLESLGVPRISSTPHVLFSEPEKSNSAGSNSKLWSSEIHLPTSQQQELDTVEQSFRLRSPNFNANELTVKSSVSLNDEQEHVLEVKDLHAQMNCDLPVMKRDEDFAALEQHIEDLTQEKFSLQRALDTSRGLAESLAAENSSLTDSYNQQGKVVSQLKSDMEKLEKEIKAQLLALDSVNVEYANAQLECNAADERAKILASEVIGLEEKALRLRSNELKLEKQLENLNSEITSYKRKVSSLEKERWDFQSTIDALQEEKKLLQSKLRKASANGNVADIKMASSNRKDACTSTDDLGPETPSLVDGQTSTAESMVNSTIYAHDIRSSVLQSSNFPSFSVLPEDTEIYLPDASSDVPHDQLRMIDNIRSLISELALEKEELMRALTIELSNNSELKDLNKDLSKRLEVQTQRLELLTAQRMATENVMAKPIDTRSVNDTMEYADEGDEVVERVLGWIMKLFPGGPAKRRTSKLL